MLDLFWRVAFHAPVEASDLASGELTWIYVESKSTNPWGVHICLCFFVLACYLLLADLGYIFNRDGQGWLGTSGS